MKVKVSKFPLMALILVISILSLVNITYHRLKKIYVQNSIDNYYQEAEESEKKLNSIFQENYVLLETFAELLSNYDVFNSEDIFYFLDDFSEKINADRIHVLLPDNTIYLPGRKIAYNDGSILFDREAKLGNHISRREQSSGQNLDEPEEFIIRQYVPVVKNGEVAALVYATIVCQHFSQFLEQSLQNEDINVFLIERDTGNFVYDGFHDSLSNIELMQNRKRPGDREYIKAIDAILESKSGFVRFSGKDDYKPKYMYYLPTVINDWTFVITVPETIVLSNFNKYKKDILLFGILIIVILILYYYMVYKENKTRENNLIVKYENIDKRNKDIINAFAEDFTTIFYVDLDADKMLIYRTVRNEAKMMNKEFGYNLCYTDFISLFVQKCVSEEDKMRVLFSFSVDNCRRIFSTRQSFSVSYLNTENAYYEIKFSKVDFDDGHLKSIVIGLSNKDFEIRNEMEHQKQLENEKIKAEMSNQAKSSFLIHMSHDIRTPINAILGFTEIAKLNSGNTEKINECLGKIELSSNHLLELLSNVVEINKIESGELTILQRLADICKSTKEVAVIAEQAAVEKGIDFEYECKNITHNKVYFDVGNLNKVMLNILTNALKYTKNGGKISYTIEEISTETSSKNSADSEKNNKATFVFTISDNGIGISEDFLNHIYESFSRDENAQISGEYGNGLGLSIVKKLISLMNGTIDIKSKKDEGTVVVCKFTFIVKGNDSDEIDGTELKSKINLSGRRVLVAEDNDMNREIERKLLEEQGVIVEEATDGYIAVEKIKKSTPGYYDFVLMDIQMPKMDGYAALNEIRMIEDIHLATIPVIAITAYAFDKDRQRALEAGMNAYLSKPLKIGEIIKVLEDIL